jgi:head-tail adaptor
MSVFAHSVSDGHWGLHPGGSIWAEVSKRQEHEWMVPGKELAIEEAAG